jgi:hypothetical protein
LTLKKGGIKMETYPVAQNNAATQTAPVVPKQDTQPIQTPAPEQQKPQTPQKDNVTLSQAAKDLAAQSSGNTPREGGLTKVLK